MTQGESKPRRRARVWRRRKTGWGSNTGERKESSQDALGERRRTACSGCWGGGGKDDGQNGGVHSRQPGELQRRNQKHWLRGSETPMSSSKQSHLGSQKLWFFFLFICYFNCGRRCSHRARRWGGGSGGCEPHQVGAGKQTRVLWRSSK